MASVDIRQFISPWPFTVAETQGLSTDEIHHTYFTSDNLNNFTDDEASLWWYAFCGGEDEAVGKVLYDRYSRVTNKSYTNETKGEISRQSCIERNAQIIIRQVGTLYYTLCVSSRSSYCSSPLSLVLL